MRAWTTQEGVHGQRRRWLCASHHAPALRLAARVRHSLLPCRAGLVVPLYSSPAEQTLAQIGIGGDIDGGPGHGEGAIDNGSISSFRDAVRRKFRLMIHGW